MQDQQQPTPFLDNSQLGELLRGTTYEENNATGHEPPVYDLAEEQVDSGPGGTDEHAFKKRKVNRQTLPRGGACEFCKRRKLKCDGAVPSCRACSKNKIDCVYSQVKQRSRVRVLEDKLAELESRMTGTPSSAETTSAIQHATSASTSTPYASNSSSPYQFLPQYPATSQGDVIPIDPELQSIEEPHLMTLANAAEAAGKPKRPKAKAFKWDGLPVETLLVEVLKAVDLPPADTVGWAIINHAVELHAKDRVEQFQQIILPLRSLLPRLASDSTNRPHPSLILSLLYNILHESPSPVLHALGPLLYTPSQNAQEIAISTGDRFIDLIRGSALRARRTIADGRYLQGWTDCGASSRLVACAGLQNITVGDVRLVLNSTGLRDEGQPSPLYEKERQMKAFRNRTAVAEHAVDEEDLKERIDLFWCIWMSDKLNTICWGWPTMFNEEFVSTPWPRPHDEPLSTVDTGTLVDLFRGQPHPPGAPADTYMTASLKALAILEKAAWLFHRPVTQDSTDATRKLLLAVTALEASLPVDFMDPTTTQKGLTPKQASKIRLRKLTMLSNMKIATAFIYFKLDIDLPSTFHLGMAVDAISKLTAGMDTLEDNDFEEFDVLLGGSWYVIGKSATRYSRHLESRPEAAQAVITLRQLVYKLIDKFKIMSKTNAASVPVIHLLENSLAGYDTMIGLSIKPDSMGRV